MAVPRRPGGPPAAPEGEVLLEFQRAGKFVRATAIDPVTGIEATVAGPVAAGEAGLRRAAIDKLRYLLARRAGKDKPPPAGRGGILV